MFNRLTPLVLPPQHGEFVNNPAVGATVITLAADYGGNNNATSAVLVTFLYVLAMDSQSTSSSHEMSARVFTDGAAQSIITLVDTPPVDVNNLTDADRLTRTILLNVPACGAWLYDLISAAHNKILSAENVQSYFASLSYDGANCQSLARFINGVKSFYPDNIADATFRSNLTQSTWTTYRLSRTSAGGILLALLVPFTEMGIFIGTDIDTIRASAAAPWDLDLAGQIRSVLKGYASIYLEAAGTGIDKWYQGNNAVAAMPAARVKGAKVIFKKYLELKNNTEKVDAITSVAEFLSVENKAFW
jgi:hypothetical protein